MDMKEIELVEKWVYRMQALKPEEPVAGLLNEISALTLEVRVGWEKIRCMSKERPLP